MAPWRTFDLAFDVASMRPGPIRPGDLARHRLNVSKERAEKCFNEARADSPGRLTAVDHVIELEPLPVTLQ